MIALVLVAAIVGAAPETDTSSVARFVTRTSTAAKAREANSKTKPKAGCEADPPAASDAACPDEAAPRRRRARPTVVPPSIERASDTGLLVTGGLGGAIALLAYRLLFFSLVTGSFTDGATIAKILAIDTLVAPLITTLPFYGLMTGSDDWDYGFWAPYLGAGLVNALLLAAAIGAGQSSEDAATAILFVDLFVVPLAAAITGAYTREIGEGERPVWSPSARVPVEPPELDGGTPTVRTTFALTFGF